MPMILDAYTVNCGWFYSDGRDGQSASPCCQRSTYQFTKGEKRRLGTCRWHKRFALAEGWVLV